MDDINTSVMSLVFNHAVVGFLSGLTLSMLVGLRNRWEYDRKRLSAFMARQHQALAESEFPVNVDKVCPQGQLPAKAKQAGFKFGMIGCWLMFALLWGLVFEATRQGHDIYGVSFEYEQIACLAMSLAVLIVMPLTTIAHYRWQRCDAEAKRDYAMHQKGFAWVRKQEAEEILNEPDGKVGEESDAANRR